MFDSNTTSSTAPNGAPPPEVIAQWKSSVQDFFSREWDSLRDLIHRLENCDWDGVELRPPAEGESNAPAFRDLVISQINTQAQVAQQQAATQAQQQHSTKLAQPIAVPQQAPALPIAPIEVPEVVGEQSPIPLFDDSEPSQTQAETTPSAVKTPETGRLADLAKRLEGKLKRRADNV